MTRSRWAILAATILALAAGVGIAVWHGNASRTGPDQPSENHPPGDEVYAEQGQPITNLRGQVGELLRQWAAEKTAAGNVGDFYDNRDRGHSLLDRRLFPQMSRAVYPPGHEGDDYGRMNFLLDHVTIGNSSTSFPVEAAGSQPRCYYCDPGGMDFLYRQYRGNNLYVYPSHHDHLPGRNGIASRGGFYGDLYPTNSPYLIISQGSSGTDQPFLQAMAATLAAFRPEVKQRLRANGLLMPTLQMILRHCSLPGDKRDQHLTGLAHPTVFNGSSLNVGQMIQMAHAIEPTNIPPMVQLRVVEEDVPILGKDYFDAGHTEKLCDTPCVIGRVFRGVAFSRRIVVSAENSFDIYNKPLQFHWNVLRQHPAQEQVTIKPMNQAGSVAEITVRYGPRFTTGEPSNIETNRVDIGCFVSNGAHWSAPGFVTFFFLDDEARTYVAGQPVEIGYGTGEAGLNVTDWPRLFASLETNVGTLRDKVWRKYLRPEQVAMLQPIGDDLRKSTRVHMDTFISQPRDSLSGLSVKQYLDTHVWPRILRDPEFYPTFRDDIEKLANSGERLKPRFDALWRRYGGMAVLRRDGNGYALQAVQPGNEPLAQRWTSFERVIVQRVHADLLGLIFDGIVEPTFHEDMVDPRLVTRSRFWRDVYRYDSAGHNIGWVRCTLDGTMEFTADGLLVLKKDAQGRPLRACQVVYEPSRMRLTKRIARCTYTGADDQRGKWEYEGPMPEEK